MWRKSRRVDIVRLVSYLLLIVTVSCLNVFWCWWCLCVCVTTGYRANNPQKVTSDYFWTTTVATAATGTRHFIPPPPSPPPSCNLFSCLSSSSSSSSSSFSSSLFVSASSFYSVCSNTTSASFSVLHQSIIMFPKYIDDCLVFDKTKFVNLFFVYFIYNLMITFFFKFFN